MANFIIWLLTAGFINRKDLIDLKIELVNAMALNVQSENYLRTDIIDLTKKIDENNDKLDMNTQELKRLNEYFQEIKNNRESKGDDDGNG